MTKVLVAGVVALALLAKSEVTLFPLVDPTDPIRLSNPLIDESNPEDPAIWVRLENTTSQPFRTNQIWLSASQFFTPSEVKKNGDDVAYFCGRLGRAEFDEFIDVVPAGKQVMAKFRIGSDCEMNAPHVHIEVHVASIGPGPSEQSIWNRDPPSFVRLLAAAMPHP